VCEAGTAIVSMLILGVPPTVQVASIGIPDTLFLMLLALVVFGPRRLPEIGRQIGKLMYEFRKVSNDFKFQMEEELRASEEADRQRKLAETQAALAAQPQAALQAPPAVIAEPAPQQPEAADLVTSANVGAESPEAVSETAPAVEGEVRGEPKRFLQDQMQGQIQASSQNQIRIQPPTTGETIAAQKPFRGRSSEVEALGQSLEQSPGQFPDQSPEQSLTQSVEAPSHNGSEAQPGLSAQAGAEEEAHHG
jgi:sec-independent protein translocase protein TatB